MNRFSLLAALCLAIPATAIADSDDDEMDFLDFDKGEENRRANEADRAPAGDVFLDEDEEDEAINWTPPTGAVDDDGGEDPDEALNDIDAGSFHSPADELDEDDPAEDLSPADRIAIMTPLADNFPLTLVAKSPDQVTVELPVLVAQGSRDFAGEAYWLVAQVVVNGTAISEGRHLITQNSISSIGPTKVWFKLAAPVDGPEADVVVRVSHAPTRGGRAEPLFSRSISIRM
jgi:hypothetical protein